MFETTDSWFYWALGNFLRTGTYQAPPPYYYQLPSTMEPPLYSLFLYIMGFLPRSDIFIHLFQLLSLGVSSYLIYIGLRKLNRYAAAVIAILFVILPANIIYAGNLLSENFSLLAVAMYTYLLYLIIEKKKTKITPWLIFYSAVATLLRYNLGTLFIPSLLLAFRGPKKRITVPLLLSIIFLTGWIRINFLLNGSVGLSNGMGKNLYDRIVAVNRLTPPLSDPAFSKLLYLTDGKVDLYEAWWPIEAYIIEFGKDPHIKSETAINNLLRDVSLHALQSNLLVYLRDIPRIYTEAYDNTLPYPPKSYIASHRFFDRPCRNLDTIQFCAPLIYSSRTLIVWDTLLEIGERYYFNFNQIAFFALILPSIFLSLISPSVFRRIIALTYFVSTFIPTLISHPDPRHVSLFYHPCN
jgi:hypothetical protein